MFGFGTKRSKADAVIEVMDEAIDIAAEKWRSFSNNLSFSANVTLADRIASFMFPFIEGARRNVPALKDAPDGVFALIVAKGIERSGAHTRAEIEQALNMKLPG